MVGRDRASDCDMLIAMPRSADYRMKLRGQTRTAHLFHSGGGQRPSKRDGVDLLNTAVSRCKQRPIGMDANPACQELLAFDAKQTPRCARFHIDAVEPKTVRVAMCEINGSTVIRPCRITRSTFRQSEPFP